MYLKFNNFIYTLINGLGPVIVKATIKAKKFATFLAF